MGQTSPHWIGVHLNTFLFDRQCHHSLDSIGTTTSNSLRHAMPLDSGPPPPTARPAQIDEDDDNPLFETILEPLTTAQLRYSKSDQLFHCETPHKTLAMGVRITSPVSPNSPLPEHPDHLPNHIIAFWHVITNVERLGLSIPFMGVPTLDDWLHEQITAFQKHATSPSRDSSPFLWTIAMGKAMAELAYPLRRQLPVDLLQVMQGGKQGWKQVNAYPMFELMDMLKCESGLRVNQPQLRPLGRSRLTADRAGGCHA